MTLIMIAWIVGHVLYLVMNNVSNILDDRN
jgi:hypothetical protein